MHLLCFAIYSANLAFGRAYKPILDAVGLTYTQYIAMVALEEDDQTVGALGERLFLESNTLTPPQEARGDGLHPASARSRRRTAGAGKPDISRPPPAGHGSRRVAVEATGLGEDFPAVQKTAARLRDNLLHATQAEPEKP